MKRTAAIVLAAVLGVSAAEAQVIRRVLSLPQEALSNVTIDDAGVAIYAVTSTNQFGTNPDYRKQIVRWDAATGAGAPVTDFEEGVESVSVSDDGTWLAFVSRADPLGTNHDESAELFVMHPDRTGLAQLTSENFLVAGNRGVRAAVLSGSANRVVFVGRVNPLGTNAAYDNALFVIDRNGTNLRQLQTGVLLPQESRPPAFWPGPVLGFDVSDDGSKIVFVRSAGDIGEINADGTANHTFNSTADAATVVISGNGLRIAYATGLSLRTVRARTFDGNTGTIVTMGTGDGPAITDDASTVCFYRPAGSAGIYSLPATGGGTLTLVSPGVGLQPVAMSGDGSRIAARDTELRAVDNTGGSQRQLTTTTTFSGAPV